MVTFARQVCSFLSIILAVDPACFRQFWHLYQFGKLVEKIISNCLQHDMIKYNLVDPNQMGGVCQHSIKDAGSFFTHLVCLG